MSHSNTELIKQMVATGDTGSRKQNDELYPLVVAGNKEARTKMIEANMSLVINKVDGYLKVYPTSVHLRDDMVSEGFVGLVQAVNKMAESNEPSSPNPTGYISHYVQHAIGSVLDKESGVGGGSKSTKWLARSKGEVIPQQVYDPTPIADQTIDPTSMVDLRDMIDSCCETEQDREIVRLRESRHTDEEIAKVLDLPKTTTYMLRRAIYGRFLAKSGMKGEV